MESNPVAAQLLPNNVIRVPLLTPDVEPLWIAHYDYPRGAFLPLHSHKDYFQMILVMGDAAGEALVGRSRLPLASGMLLFLRPGLEHGLAASGTSSVRTLDTKFRVRHRRLREACGLLDPVQSEPDRRLVGLLEAMHAEAQRAAELSAESCQTLLTEILMLLLKSRLSGSSAHSAADAEHEDRTADLAGQVHRYLRDRCGEEISQRSLGARFHRSYHHIHGLYRRHYGESPLRALKRLRVERAQQLIRYSDYELKQIARMVGFATIHHFTRVFKNLTQVSPARWRDQDLFESRRDITIHPGFVNQNLVQSIRR